QRKNASFRGPRLNLPAPRHRDSGPRPTAAAAGVEPRRPTVDAGTRGVIGLLIRVQERTAIADAKSAGALLFPAILTHRNRRPADVAGRVRVGGQELVTPRKPSLRGKLNAVELGLEVRRVRLELSVRAEVLRQLVD